MNKEKKKEKKSIYYKRAKYNKARQLHYKLGLVSQSGASIITM